MLQWKKKVIQNLGIFTTLFTFITMFLLANMNSYEELSPHSHKDDISIIEEHRPSLVYDDRLSGKRDPPFNLSNQQKLSKNSNSFDDKLNLSTQKSSKKQLKTLIMRTVVNDSNLADLSNPWDVDAVDQNNPSKYMLPREDFNESISDSTLIQRMNRLRSNMKDCWARYKECAWGSDKLHPDSCTGSNWFGIGLTVLDSLDTLFLMGLKVEFAEATDFVKTVDLRRGSNNVNIFEITIRVLGAFLTAFHFTRDQIFISKAVELGDLLLESGAFNTSSGIPLSDIDLPTGLSHMPTCNGCNTASSLSEVTTIQLEFNELTRITGDYKYKDATDRAMRGVLDHLPPDRLPRNYVDVRSGITSGTLTLGARGDSYYEYLLKQWIQTRDHRLWDEYNKSMLSVKNKLVFTSLRNLTYIAEIRQNNKVSHKMDHLVCFLPGTLALGAHFGAPSWHLTLAEDLVRSCIAMYNTQSGLAPEIVKFNEKSRLYSTSTDEFSLLRPETVESLFILWRVTHKLKYRSWAWDIYSAMEKSAKHPSYGFSSMDKVNSKKPIRKGHLESFFLAETLKYLYLIQGPDDILPLERYVFNTEAHPFPIQTEFFSRPHLP